MSDTHGIKRERPDDASQDPNKKARADLVGTEGMEGALLTKLARMEVLYKEVLVQAALIYQHQTFSQRLGQPTHKVPSHMIHRLEASWRSYEGLRRQTEWYMSQTGQKPTQPSLQNKTIVFPSTSLEKIGKTIPLPLPVHLNGLPPALSPHVPITSPLSRKNSQAAIPANFALTSTTALAATSAPETTADGSTVDQPTDLTVEVKTIVPVEPVSQLPAPSLQLQTPIDLAPPLVSAITAIPQADLPQQSENIDYSSLGLDELNALINGDSNFLNGAFDTSSNSTTLPVQAPAQTQLLATAIPQQAAPNANGQDDILSSLSSNFTFPPPRDQPVQFDFSSALTAAAAGLESTSATGSVNGADDFSALAGLFPSNLDFTGPIGQGTDMGGIDGLIAELSRAPSPVAMPPPLPAPAPVTMPVGSNQVAEPAGGGQQSAAGSQSHAQSQAPMIDQTQPVRPTQPGSAKADHAQLPPSSESEPLQQQLQLQQEQQPSTATIPAPASASVPVPAPAVPINNPGPTLPPAVAAAAASAPPPPPPPLPLPVPAPAPAITSAEPDFLANIGVNLGDPGQGQGQHPDPDPNQPFTAEPDDMGGGIDMSDFDFSGVPGMESDEFERLMAEFA